MLQETRHLRGIIFAGTNYIGSELLWSALKDVSDNESIRKTLELLMCCETDSEAVQSFLELFRTVGTKLHIIQQISKQLEDGSLSQFDSTKRNIQYCFVEFSFFITWLVKLRKGSGEARWIKVSLQLYANLAHQTKNSRLSLERNDRGAQGPVFGAVDPIYIILPTSSSAFFKEKLALPSR